MMCSSPQQRYGLCTTHPLSVYAALSVCRNFVLSVVVLQAIADMVTEENLAEGRLYPPLNTIREVSFKIAVKVGDVTEL